MFLLELMSFYSKILKKSPFRAVFCDIQCQKKNSHEIFV